MTSPLRPDLYNRLVRRAGSCGFGEVRIVYEGEAMAAHVDDDWRNPGRMKLVVDSHGENYRVNCCFCNDTRGRLWINHMWGKYDPQTRSLNLWLAHCYNQEECMSYYGNQRKLYDMIYNDIFNHRDFPDPVRRGVKPSHRSHDYRPAGEYVYPLHKLDFDHPAVLYLRQRGYDTDWLGREMQVGYCSVAAPEFPLAHDRIIIPIVFRGQNVGWQARSIGEPVGGMPKYLTMKNMRKSEVLYNFDAAKQHPFVVLTEGCTKVWSIGPEAVAQLGDKLSSVQAGLLGGNWETVVVYLDGNAHEQAETAILAIRGVKNRVLVRLPPDKEPGDFARDYNRALIYHEAKRQGVSLPDTMLELK